MELVRHGHVHDSAAHQPRLGFLGPGELIHCQVDLKSQVADFPHNFLVGETEGVKCSREEGHFVPHRNLNLSAVHMPLRDELVNGRQRGGPVEHGRHGRIFFVELEENLAPSQHEEGILFIQGKGILVEDIIHHPERFLADRLPVVGQAAENGAQQGFLLLLILFVADFVAAPVAGIMAQHDAEGIQGAGRHLHIRAGLKANQVTDHLIQLGRREPQGALSQILRDVVGEIKISYLNALPQFHDHFIALVCPQIMQDIQESLTGILPHHHILADLDEIGQVGGDMQLVGHFPVMELILQELDIDGLDNPGRRCFQVFQENVGDHILIIEDMLFLCHILTQIPENPQLEIGHRDIIGRIGIQDNIPECPAPFQLRLMIRQYLGASPGGNPHLFRRMRRIIKGKCGNLIQLLIRKFCQGQLMNRIHNHEGLVLFPGFGRSEALHENAQVISPVALGTVLQDGGKYILRIEADSPLLPCHQLQVRMKQKLQDLFRHRIGLAGIQIGHIRRALFPVAEIKLGENLAHQLGCLGADLALPVHQQLIQEIEDLLLLAVIGVGAEIEENAQIGPQILPVLLASGRLQEIAELPLRTHQMHDVDIVLHAHMNKGPDALLRIPESQLRHRRWPLGLSVQIRIRSHGLHIFLEVPESFIDELIAKKLLFVHIVQLVQDNVEGILQTGDKGDLLIILSAALLNPEVRIDQHQGLHGQVLRLQVPGGMVGGDMADIIHIVAAEPLVRVIIV